jgi:hypothetical protein
MLNSKNTIVISTTIPKNITSEARRNNLINNFSKWNIPVLLNPGIIDNTLPNHNIMFNIIKNAFEIYKKSNYEYAIICDDDFFPIDNFLGELNKTVDLLPYNWRCLHLCPGYLWGRRFRNKDKIGLLNAEYNMTGIQYHESGRFYLNCTGDTYFNKKFFLGGPIAIVINKNNFESLLNDFVSQYEKSNLPNDVILTKILNANDYICREPQLGYEEQEGGTTFK